MDIQIREQRLPGLGHRYDLVLNHQRSVMVVVEHTGRRELGVVSAGADRPDVTVTLTQDQAVALAAVLTGARFSIDTTHDERITGNQVVVETVTLGSSSPAVGKLVGDVELADRDAEMLAVINDDTPELVEPEQGRRFRAGDRVVVAVRRECLADVVAQLAG